MKILFLKDVRKLRFNMKVNDELELSDNDSLSVLNDELYILIYHGLRYDLKKDEIKVIEL